MNRKLIIIIVFIISVLFISCSGQSGNTDTTTITIWHDKEEPVIAVLEKNLEVLEPGITVIFEKKSSLTESLKLVGNDLKSAPDMYLFAHDKIGVYAEMGILAPITDFISIEELSENIPLVIDAGEYKGINYQLPLYFETMLFMYNRKYMKSDSIPKTTEELFSYMEKKTKYGHYGFVEQHSTPYYAAGWIHGFGTDLVDESGTPLLDSDQVKRALEYHRKFVSLMPGETEYATVNTLFTEGMAHSTMNGPWFIATVKAAGIDVGIAPMPTVDETGIPIAPYCGVQGLHVLKTNAVSKKDAITSVLRTLMINTPEIELALATGCAPALMACYEDSRITENDIVMAMRETAENAIPMPNIPEMDVLWSVTGNLLTDINMRGVDVDSACEAAQKKALDLIEAMQ